MAEITRERREEMRRITEHYGADRDDVIWHVCMAELSALLDAADERDRLRGRYESPPPPVNASNQWSSYDAVTAATREADRRLATLRKALSKDPTDAPL